MDHHRRRRLDRRLWAGMHWLASKYTGEEKYRAQAAALAQGLKNRITVDTVFKSFPLYFGAPGF